MCIYMYTDTHNIYIQSRQGLKVKINKFAPIHLSEALHIVTIIV